MIIFKKDLLLPQVQGFRFNKKKNNNRIQFKIMLNRYKDFSNIYLQSMLFFSIRKLSNKMNWKLEKFIQMLNNKF